ncbi:MAG: hypothetical protein KF825_13840 [Ferruginibacter sp.]|nr:hypothetical protein [Ferruginibacter sp.]
MITIINWTPAQMLAENKCRNRGQRKIRKTERTNCQMATGDDTKLLLHNSDFYKHLSAKAEKKPKGNGIKDGFVCWGCVYAVVFWFFCRASAEGCRSYFCGIKNTMAKIVSFTNASPLISSVLHSYF